MSTIVWCPCCLTKQISHAPHGLVPPHPWPTNLAATCIGVGQVGLTGLGTAVAS